MITTIMIIIIGLHLPVKRRNRFSRGANREPITRLFFIIERAHLKKKKKKNPWWTDTFGLSDLPFVTIESLACMLCLPISVKYRTQLITNISAPVGI